MEHSPQLYQPVDEKRASYFREYYWSLAVVYSQQMSEAQKHGITFTTEQLRRKQGTGGAYVLISSLFNNSIMYQNPGDLLTYITDIVQEYQQTGTSQPVSAYEQAAAETLNNTRADLEYYLSRGTTPEASETLFAPYSQELILEMANYGVLPFGSRDIF